MNIAEGARGGKVKHMFTAQGKEDKTGANGIKRKSTGDYFVFK